MPWRPRLWRCSGYESTVEAGWIGAEAVCPAYTVCISVSPLYTRRKIATAASVLRPNRKRFLIDDWLYWMTQVLTKLTPLLPKVGFILFSLTDMEAERRL